MIQHIEPGDLVFAPEYSNKVLVVHTDLYGRYFVSDSGKVLYFNSLGFIDNSQIHPSVWLATPENKTKLERFYGTELHKPFEDDFQSFVKTLDKYTTLIANQSDNQDEEVALYSQLLHLYKHR